MNLFTSLWGFFRVGMSPVKSDLPVRLGLSKNLAMNYDRTSEHDTKEIVLEILSFLIMGTIRANGEKILPPSKRTPVSIITIYYHTWTL